MKKLFLIICMALMVAGCGTTATLSTQQQIDRAEVLAVNSVTAGRRISMALMTGGKITVAQDAANAAKFDAMIAAIKAAASIGDLNGIKTQQANAEKLQASIQGAN